jgi:hydroxyacylglutathione hydrolase
MIKVTTFVFNAFQENTYILQDETSECVIIDPGFGSQGEKTELADFIVSAGLKPVAVLNTHCHIDHILGCAELQKDYNIPFYIQRMEAELLNSASVYATYFGLEIKAVPVPDNFLDEGDEYQFGKSSLSVFHVPGHSPGSICFYSIKDKFVVTGDVLFRGSIGRTDLPGGDYNALIKNIKTKLLILPREVLVFPGHGPTTNIGHESDTNPFLN